jgi:DnaJ-class molecular chaperone
VEITPRKANKMSDDPLRILGLNPGSNLEDARESYRRLCLQYHPDKNPDGETQFHKITAAYAQVRSNPSLLYPISHSSTGVVSYLSGSVKVSMRDVYYAEEKCVSFQRLAKCSDCDGTGSADMKQGVCNLCSGRGIIDSAMLSIMGRDNICPSCKGTGIVGRLCETCHGNKTMNESVVSSFRATLKCYYRKGVLLKGMGNSRPDGSNEDLMVKLQIQKDPYVSVEGISFKVYLHRTPAQRASGDKGILKLFDRSIPYSFSPNEESVVVEDGVRPGFKRTVQIVFKDYVPALTPETEDLYNRIKEAESKSCNLIGSMILTTLCEESAKSK